MSIKKSLTLVLAVALGANAQGRLSRVDLEPVTAPSHHRDAFVAGSVSRACTFGLRTLEAYFRERGLPFDFQIVNSHKGRDCHLFFEPSVSGFQALPDSEVPRELASRRGQRMIGLSGKKVVLLKAQNTTETVASESAEVLSSKLSWAASDLRVMRDPKDPSRTVLYYGDAVRTLFGRSMSDDECSYLLRVEFGVAQAIHVHTGSRSQLPGTPGGLASMNAHGN
jgi:hypothetical protein